MKERLGNAEGCIGLLKSQLGDFNKENKFISENLKRLSNDKLRLEKRIR